MTQRREWQEWKAREHKTLGESIAWAAQIFKTTDVEIEGSRHYGTALLAHSIECARAIRRCINDGFPGPAFSLARAQYEGALRGHIIIHEISLEELGSLLNSIQEWRHKKQPKQQFPMIEIKGTEWKIRGARANRQFRPFRDGIAKIFVASDESMRLLHDLTHSGISHALNMFDENGYICPRYSDRDQTLLLSFADQIVMFAIMTWPGAVQQYGEEIEHRVEKTYQMRSEWEPHALVQGEVSILWRKA